MITYSNVINIMNVIINKLCRTVAHQEQDWTSLALSVDPVNAAFVEG